MSCRGGREGERERGREGEREKEREGGRKGGREGGKRKRERDSTISQSRSAVDGGESVIS